MGVKTEYIFILLHRRLKFVGYYFLLQKRGMHNIDDTYIVLMTCILY